MAAAGVASRSGALASCSRQAAGLSVRSVSLVPVALLTQRCSPSQRGYGAQRLVVLPAPAQRAGCTRRIGALSVQASLVARVARIARAYLGGASDSLLSSLERPELMITQAVEEMSSDLTKAKQAYVRVLADHRLAQRRARVAADSVDTWQRRAEQAVQKGEDELAREALKRKRTAMEEKGLAEAQAADLEAAANTLGESIKVLAGRVAEARAKERGLVARARAAEAQAAQQAALAELVAGLPQPGTAWAEFDRMEAKVGEMEALAAATAEVAGSGSLLGSGGSNNDAGRRLLAMDADARLDAELEAIKRGLTAHQQPQRALPPFQSSR